MTSEWVTAPPRVTSKIEKLVEDAVVEKLAPPPHDQWWRDQVRQVVWETLRQFSMISDQRGVKFAITRENLGGGWAAPLGKRR